MMKKIKVHCSWELEIDLEHEKQIELYVDQIPQNPVPEDTVRFVFLLEPPEIQDLTQHAKWGIQNNTYNHLFTHNQELLDFAENSTVFPLASTWIQNYSFPDKEFSVSALVGGKLLAPGHHLRHKVWFKEDKITAPRRFFLSGNYGGIENYNNNPILGKDKSPLFDSQFHICIENANRRNWFTEKLIDCMVTKTVPVYWGCPNIGDWFDTRGFIVANDFKEIVNACNSLDENTYSEMLPYIEENYKKGLELANISVRLKNDILKIIN
jgi:RNA recognition motif-containing protein